MHKTHESSHVEQDALLVRTNASSACSDAALTLCEQTFVDLSQIGTRQVQRDTGKAQLKWLRLVTLHKICSFVAR